MNDKVALTGASLLSCEEDGPFLFSGSLSSRLDDDDDEDEEDDDEYEDEDDEDDDDVKDEVKESTHRLIQIHALLHTR